ncbi:protein Wiz-like isoform X2 [Anarrhichthys ocellatus]|uniref:protein Wiz-like isoform X2 n=1 Tax=Anarrhichthys ocellatus TaxID=433405 RepID=UPI0012EE462E|nr:protein Wiz-like isoform X2 [Anarrhichthys ocellatus]
MESNEPRAVTRCRGGHFCIAPGCSNEFYRAKNEGKTVHFHSLPFARHVVLRRWLAALRRGTTPVRRGARVCSEHFVDEDYVGESVFESGVLVVRRTNKLKTEAAPSVFDFSSQKVGCAGQDVTSAVRRKKRARRHAHLAAQRKDLQRFTSLILQKKPTKMSAAMDSPATATPVICEVCGTFFETRRGLSSHARLHLRQLGVTLSESSGAPIELLYQLIQERGDSLPDFKADSSVPGPTPLKKASQQESRTPSAPEDSGDSGKAGSRVTTAPQKMDHQGSPARLKETPTSPAPSSSSGLRPVECRTSEGSSSSSEHKTKTKPLWAPLETDAPITLASDTKNEVHVCQLCGCWYGTRKGLSGHARAHLRQIGIPDSDIKGSPIQLLYQIMEEEDLKPISSEQQEGASTSNSPSRSSSKRPSNRSSPPASPPSKRPKSSEDFTCILCREKFENRKGLAIHARAHLRQIGVVDLLGKSSAIDAVQELVSNGMLEAVHPPNMNSATSSSAAPFPSTSLSSSPVKYARSPVNRAPKAKKGFRLAVDPLHRKPKPEPMEIEVSVQPKGSGTIGNSPTQKSPPASKPLNADVQSPPTVLCDFCGQLFETRKALSCHARAHLRQLGLTWSTRTSPIDLLREVMMRGEEGKKVSVLAGSSGKATWAPQGSRRSHDRLQPGEPAANPSTAPLDYSMKEKPSSGRSGASHTDASCELCGFDFENRKALASHARAHLRQLGITEWKADGASSPIELLSELIRRDPVKVAAITQRYRMGDLYIKKSQRGAASPPLSTDSDSVAGSSLKFSVSRENLGVTAGSSRHSNGHGRTFAAHGDPGVRSSRGVHPPKHVARAREENQDTNSQQPSRSGSIPAMLPKPPLTPLVKLVGKVYSLKCRFCEEVFHGPLSVQERWITHLQKHILSLGYKGKASPPAAPVAAPALVHPVAV